MSFLQFEGYAIVSADGMLAAADGIMPPSLKFDADQNFLSDGLDEVDVIVHGRNSFEDQANSPQRRRIYATRSVDRPAASSDSDNVYLWNPATTPVESALALTGVTSGRVAIIGGTEIFDMFLDRYDTFWLSHAPRVALPNGVPVFSGVPLQTPGDILQHHGLTRRETRMLDPSHDVHVVKWARK